MGRLDGIVHAIAFAPEDAIGGNFLSAPAESALEAFRTSAFSLKALAAALAPLMDSGASVVGLDFDASVAWPIYDWMGVAKAALESVSRYLARDLGPAGIRVNLVSAGPLGTVAARGIPGFERLAGAVAQTSPAGLGHRGPSPVASAICFLLSDYARAITGEILHVDGGFHAVGAPSRRVVLRGPAGRHAPASPLPEQILRRRPAQRRGPGHPRRSRADRHRE